MFVRKVAVKNYYNVGNVWGGRQSGAVNSEEEFVSGFGDVFGSNKHYIKFMTVQFRDVGLSEAEEEVIGNFEKSCFSDVLHVEYRVKWLKLIIINGVRL